MKKLFSIVIPVYGNELNLPVTIPHILELIPTLFSKYDVELVLVDDGSPDRSWEIMKEYRAQYPETIRIVSLIHNFGQGKATACGIRAARGDLIGVISADLQDPIELFADMLNELEEGYDLVCGVRDKREERGAGMIFSKITHFLIKRLITDEYPKGGFDFCAMNRKMANRFLSLKERNGSGQLMMLWASGATKFIAYTRAKRELGKSGWTFSKKLKYFIDTFVSNSYFPIRLISGAGIFFAGISFLASIYVFINALAPDRTVPGWASTVLLIMFFSGFILAALGVIGEYLWRVYDEVRGRPLYLIRESSDEDAEEGAAAGDGPSEPAEAEGR